MIQSVLMLTNAEVRYYTYIYAIANMKTRSALGLVAPAMEDMNQAIKLCPDADSYQQRGHLYIRLVS
jgi:hypothetical protein